MASHENMKFIFIVMQVFAEHLIFSVMLAHLESKGLFMCCISLRDRLFGDFFLSAAENENQSDKTWWPQDTQNEIRKESSRLIASGGGLSHQLLFI